MLHFENDYNKGIHPQLLQALVDSNQEVLLVMAWIVIVHRLQKR